jgi:hypothetical protein
MSAMGYSRRLLSTSGERSWGYWMMNAMPRLLFVAPNLCMLVINIGDPFGVQSLGLGFRV